VPVGIFEEVQAEVATLVLPEGGELPPEPEEPAADEVVAEEPAAEELVAEGPEVFEEAAEEATEEAPEQ
jgi:hypothetical protein